MKILIIEDSEVTRLILKKCIENVIGFEVVGEAKNGIEGIRKYKELNPDLITLDISMPKMNGIDCIKAIIEYDKNAKALICSALSQRKVIDEALEAGAIDYINKPIDKNEFIKKLKEIYDKL